MCPRKSWGGQGGGQHTAPWPGQESWLGPQAGFCMCSTEEAGLPGSCPPGGSTHLSLFTLIKILTGFWQMGKKSICNS